VKANHSHYIERWLAHVRQFAVEIGPRGSTTPEERQASAYCAKVMQGLGLSPQTEPFTSARSIYHPHLLASAMMLIAFAIYPLAGRASAAAAAVLSLLALVFDLMELSFIDNPLRLLVPKGRSQNVIAQIPPRGNHKRDLVLIGHMDSHRTPIIFSTSRWVAAYQAYTTAAFLLFVLQVALYGLGAVTQWPWVWPTSIPSALCAALLALICIHADRTPFSAGANDNATGAGMVLTLAEHLQAEPLQHTRVWLANTGCEEVQHYGAIDFFRRHQSQLHNPVTVVFEMLGCEGPSWLIKEGVVIPFRSDKRLAALAEKVASEHPEWRARPGMVNGANTEMADALRAGIPAITIMGMGPTFDTSYWHQVGDTYDKMDTEAMARSYAFTWAYLQAIDGMEML
jgi:hypothetical protein